MARRLPPLNAVRVFEAAARRASVQDAAEELAVTPGAVSRQIRKLEEWLGTELFRRGQHGLTVTDAGSAYRVAVADALDRIAVATERLQAEERDGPLRIACFPTFAIRWLIPRWGRFYDRHPGIDVQLTTSLAAIDFARDRFDAAIRDGRGDWSATRCLRLTGINYFPVCSPALLQSRPIEQPADLRHHTLLHSQPSPRDWHHWLAAAGVDGVDPDHGIRFESLSLAYQAAIEGIGIAMGIEELVADDLRRGRLVRLFDLSRLSTRSFYLLWPVARDGDANVRALVRWLREEARSGISA